MLTLWYLATSVFTYDGDGLRTSKTVGNTTWQYIYNGDNLVQMTDDTNTLHFYYDASGVMGVNYNGTDYFYLKNIQGDVIAIATSSGTVVVEYTYDAWGNPLSTTGSMASTLGAINPLRYRGYVYDAETGLYYLQSRYYSPRICRFINADNFISTGTGILSNNMFCYCNNNPSVFSDNSGSFPTILVGVGSGAVLGIIATAISSVLGITNKKTSSNIKIQKKTDTSLLSVFALFALSQAYTKAYQRAYEEDDSNSPKDHTVYKLVDSAGNAQYIGRTKNPGLREAAHKSNPARSHLQFVPIKSGLTYSQARGFEQIEMLNCHTINKVNPANNQIFGISPKNPKLEFYMYCGRAVASYLENKVSNEVLYWTGN